MLADARDRQRDLRCLVLAFAAHMGVLSGNPRLSWGPGAKADVPIPVEFVTELPKAAVTPQLAPEKPGGGPIVAMKRYGPGKLQPEKVKAGLPDASTKAAPARKRRPMSVARKRALAREETKRLAADAALPAGRGGRRRRLSRAGWRSGFGGEGIEADLRDGLAGRSPAVPALAGATGAAGLAGAFRPSDFPAGNPGFARDGRGGADDVNARPVGGGVDDGGGGVSWLVEGPVGKRRVLKRVLPRCPDWVSQRGLELTVQLRFQVLENGSVRTAVVLKRTSGFPDVDRLAIEALRRWRFQPIHSGVGLASPEAWGVVSFKFLMG